MLFLDFLTNLLTPEVDPARTEDRMGKRVIFSYRWSKYPSNQAVSYHDANPGRRPMTEVLIPLVRGRDFCSGQSTVDRTAAGLAKLAGCDGSDSEI